MSNTQTQLYQDLLRKALGKKSNNTKGRKLDTKKNYSSFWMDDLGKGNDRFGLGSEFSGKNSDIVKAVKLNSYRRAIANFVKILTNKEIPVRFHGSDSYTNGRSVNISADIKDNNFDVSVGLALHEASHILLTDFSILPRLNSREIKGAEHLSPVILKEILNYVEDRRIDHYVFSTSPGYKAYYHKLYEHYWNNDKTVIKGLLSSKFRDPADIDSWLFRIFNMMNPAFDATVMPGLSDIVNLIDIPNISRLKSTQDALEVAIAVTQIIVDQMEAAAAKKQDQPEPSGAGNAPGEGGEEGEEGQEKLPTDSESDDTQEEDDSSEDQQDSDGGAGDEDSEGEGEGQGAGGDEDSDGGEELSSTEAAAVEQVLRDQRTFTNGEIHKASANRNLRQKMERVEKEGVTVESVWKGVTCLNYDVTGKEFIAAASALETGYPELMEVRSLPTGPARKLAQDQYDSKYQPLKDLLNYSYFRTPRETNKQGIAKGMQMGQLLGRKLQMRNESRERIDNRLRSGKIDNRRLSAAGYGIESVFQQITVDKYKKANLHLSLDGSGSMSGSKWFNTLTMTTAIAKGLTFTSNVAMQISIRVTSQNGVMVPANYLIYDSRKNTLRELEVILGAFEPNGCTPEGLCFESMIKKNQLVRSNADIDSYFLNISDGGPGGVSNYQGETARLHTNAQVTKMRNEYGMGVLSYFVTDYATDNFESSGTGRMFIGMYGKAATAVKADNVMDIAKTLNKLFMNK